jgi:hypothetical protein
MKTNVHSVQSVLFVLARFIDPLVSCVKRRYFHTEISKDFRSIQCVSEFDRQTFRADSMIKNKHKTLNTYGVKNV